MDQLQSLTTPFLGNLVEICIVTRSHRRTIDGLLRLGIGPFQIHTFTPDTVSQQTYRGKPSPFSLKVCFAKQGSLTWEIMEPLGDGPSIMADFLSSHGEGIHHVAFDCDNIPVSQRKAEFQKRGFDLVQEGIWHGKTGTCHFNFFDTESATTTCFESYDFSPDWEDPDDTVWYPGPPSLPLAPATQEAPLPPSTLPTRLTPLPPGTSNILHAGHGASACIARGHSLKITNTGGKQVVDLFAFALPPDFRPQPAARLGYLSLPHTRTTNLRRDPRAGDTLYSHLRRPMLHLSADTSPGAHDSSIAACDAARYRQLGVRGYHRSCAENLRDALREAGALEELFPGVDLLSAAPGPWNLFMNVKVREDGGVEFLAGEGGPGDFVALRAEVDCLVVLSACPMEKALSPINEACDVVLEVLGA